MRTITGEVVCQYLREYPSHPSKTIAHLLHEREPKLFPTEEAARSLVRHYRGNHGNRTRKVMGGREFYRPNGTQIIGGNVV